MGGDFGVGRVVGEVHIVVYGVGVVDIVVVVVIVLTLELLIVLVLVQSLHSLLWYPVKSLLQVNKSKVQVPLAIFTPKIVLA